MSASVAARGFVRSFARCVMLVLVASFALVPAPTARAEGANGWPLRSRGAILLRFGASYASSAPGGSSTHRGVDIAADAGDEVLAPFAGTLTFVGRVPSQGGSGTQLAATVERGDGLKFTLMPLDDVNAATGARVEAGAPVATLARDGDASSSGAHLHVGVRRGDLYLDPEEYLVVPAPGAGGTAQPVQAPAETEVQEPAVHTQPAEVVVPREAEVAAEPAAGTAEAPVLQSEPGPVASGATQVFTAPVAEPSASTASGAHGPSAVSGVGGLAHGGVVSSRFAFPAGSVGVRSGVLASLAGPLQSRGGAVPSATMEVGVRSGSPLDVSNAYASGPQDTRAYSAPMEARLPEASSPPSRIIDRIASVARRSPRDLARGWSVALLGVLAAAGALWPLWRRDKPDDEPERSVTPVGSEVAAAAGR